MRETRSIWWVVAIVTAWGAGAACPAGTSVLGTEPVTDELMYEVDPAEPVSLLLSKTKYPLEDGHLDAIVWLGPRVGNAPGRLEVRVEDAAGRVLSRETIAPIPLSRLFMSPRIPPELAGQAGRLRVTWSDATGRRKGEASSAFEVLPDAQPPRAGRVRLTIPNDHAVAMAGVPVTTGVPFPRGALTDEANVRLVDEHGVELPLQTRITARWSRFGSIRWLKCDTVVDLAGGPKTLYLEYGPEIRRSAVADALTVDGTSVGTPRIDAGLLRVDAEGLHVRVGERFERVIDGPSLRGAYVVGDDGRRYAVPADVSFEAEETGPVRAVVRAAGWYQEPTTGRRFCQFVTRYVVTHDSPLVRVFHTWIFTGDAYADRMRDIGWRFDLGDGASPGGFLLDSNAAWQPGRYVLQRDDARFILAAEDGVAAEIDGRVPGVFAATTGRGRVTIGVRDFWQNYPHELEFADGAMIYHLWPAHNPPAVHELTPANATRLWFAHEGERLDFAIPEAYTRPPIALEIPESRRNSGYTLEKDRQRQGNAQGVAKTSELWLLITPADEPADATVAVMRGLQDWTLHAAVDPVWVAASGAFYEMHPRDAKTYPEAEAVYELHALAPLRWAERVHLYGKWIWGAGTWEPLFPEQRTAMYRTFRKAHQGWPYSWMPYARSGDPRFLVMADAATRFMTDIAFVHYSDVRVPSYHDPHRARPRGWYTRSHYPWAHHRPWPHTRSRECEVDFLLYSYYLTGNHRSLDVLEDYRQLVKYDGAGIKDEVDDRLVFKGILDGRTSVELLQTYTQMYEATFDPWFLAAMHQIARVHKRIAREDGWKGHFDSTGPREFHRFTQDDDYFQTVYLPYARKWSDRRGGFSGTGTGPWPDLTPMSEAASYAYLVTGDETFLRRAVNAIDTATWETYRGEPDYYKGVVVPQGWQFKETTHYTGYFLREFPAALAALDRARRAGHDLLPVPNAFYYLPEPSAVSSEGGQTLYTYRWRIAIRKPDAQAVPIELRFDDKKHPFRYELRHASGSVVASGTTTDGAVMTLTIPADAPSGTYRLAVALDSKIGPADRIRGLPALAIPVTPPGTPEVIELEPGEPVGRGYRHSQFWFLVPSGADAITVHFPLVERTWRNRSQLHMLSVHDPSGRAVWREHFDAMTDRRAGPIAAQVSIPPDQQGKLWRITRQGDLAGFSIEGPVPLILAADPHRWFDPDRATH